MTSLELAGVQEMPHRQNPIWNYTKLEKKNQRKLGVLMITLHGQCLKIQMNFLLAPGVPLCLNISTEMMFVRLFTFLMK
jgi:hypothetical protein